QRPKPRPRRKHRSRLSRRPKLLAKRKHPPRPRLTPKRPSSAATRSDQDRQTQDRQTQDRRKERKAIHMAGTLTKEQILDGIAELSVIQLSELLKDFEERFGVTAAAPVAVAAVGAAPAAGGGDAGGGDEEKVEFDVILTDAGDKKIQVIKEV